MGPDDITVSKPKKKRLDEMKLRKLTVGGPKMPKVEYHKYQPMGGQDDVDFIRVDHTEIFPCWFQLTRP